VRCCRFQCCEINDSSAIAPYYHTCLCYEMADIRLLLDVETDFVIITIFLIFKVIKRVHQAK
jgi:hypothetical protein